MKALSGSIGFDLSEPASSPTTTRGRLSRWPGNTTSNWSGYLAAARPKRASSRTSTRCPWRRTIRRLLRAAGHPRGVHPHAQRPAPRAGPAGDPRRQASARRKPLEIDLARVDTCSTRRKRRASPSNASGAFHRRRAGPQGRADAGCLGGYACAAPTSSGTAARSTTAAGKGTLAVDGGGAVINQSIHAVDLLQWLVGMPSEIFAWKTRRVHLDIEAEDTACAALHFSTARWARSR